MTKRLEYFQRDFALSLKRTREAMGISQVELAKRTGYSIAHISFLETCRRIPSVDAMLTIAEALNCELSVKFITVRS